jgi:hypothetical protein
MNEKVKIMIILLVALIVFITMIGLISFNLAPVSTPISSVATNALIIYDQSDATGASKNFAQEVTKSLQAQNYAVTLTTAGSSTANRTRGYHVIVIGGRFEDGKFLNSTQYALHSLVMRHDYLAKCGVFTVQDSLSPDDWININWCLPIFSDDIFSNATRVQLTPNDDLVIKAQDFVNQIIEAAPRG